MRMSSILRLLVTMLVSAGALLSCGFDAYSSSALSLWPETYEDAGPLPVEAAASVDAGPGTCRQAHARSLPQRLVTMSALANHSGSTLDANDLFAYFDASVCGGACHGTASAPPGLGNWRIANPTQLTLIDQSVIAHVMSEGPTNLAQPNSVTDPKDPMPPYGNALYRPYSQRLPGDPVIAFVTLFQRWIDDGSPRVEFTPPDGVISTSGGDHYVNTPGVGIDMTNIGNCVPDAILVGQSRNPSSPNMVVMTALDNTFANGDITPSSTAGAASQIGLPDDLFKTDLTTFDSNALASLGVISYQPTYPNWFDDAQMIRHVRVPVGQSIRFNKAIQSFTIPDNTRFYETILKKIADVDGSYRWRKIETRILVVRNSSTPLVGTYLWDDAESDAPLWAGVLAARNDGQPFKATTLFYNTDEQLAKDLSTQPSGNPQLVLVNGRAARHYAVPSRDQCGACHQGSSTGNFVLGFTPLQLNRRPYGEGGVRDTPGSDEMTQLQRFIDYGLITGMRFPADVTPLEKTEGTRAPRNDYELAAQAYMTGNCAHCHNPNGTATKNNPELAGVLDFRPTPASGIFQFPLDKVSPRIPRGPVATIPVPYITPSLMDLSESAKIFGDVVLYAPWRSLIFRAVDTPFPYTDDNALFPHMPMNGAGYDCASKRIMSDWMVSIPATRKSPQLVEYGSGVSNLDDTPQPYAEVLPGSVGYDQAATEAQERLAMLHDGINPTVRVLPKNRFSEYAYCPDTSDILDPAVLGDPTCHPVPDSSEGPFPQDNIPSHADWIPVDTTIASTNWSPAVPNWPQTLVYESPDPPSLTCGQANYAEAVQVQSEEMVAVDLLQSATLGQVKSFATKPFPVGLWSANPGCNMSSQQTVSQFTANGGYPARWLTNPAAGIVSPDSSYVYAEWPGAYVYSQICGNCHGANADGHGRLATNLALMTGGHGIPSNFMAGLFGPQDHPGINAMSAFLSVFVDNPDAGATALAWNTVTGDDRAARYVTWMGLGGTGVIIPDPVVQIVATSSVFGLKRSLPPSLISANMLSVAKALCLNLLFGRLSDPVATESAINGGKSEIDVEPVWFTTDPTGEVLKANNQVFASSGDAELWLNLCGAANPPPVRALYGEEFDSIIRHGIRVDATSSGTNSFSLDLYDPAFYGSYPVGNDLGLQDDGGVTPTNLQPYCYRPEFVDPSSPQTPLCPSTVAPYVARDLSAEAGGEPLCSNNVTHCWGPKEADAWATRGAINAGLAVYLYLQAVANQSQPILPPYNKCQALSPQQ